MTDAYREDWDITSEEGSLCFASAIYSRLVGGEQDEATLQWLAKYLRANAAPHQHTTTPAPYDSLLDRVGDAIAREATSAGIVNDRPARAAIREVAAALIDWHDSDEVVRTAYEAGQWLKREADA